jgi:hypothetical protein
MIVDMGCRIFRGRHVGRVSQVSYDYQVFIDVGRHATTWRTSIKRATGPLDLSGALPAEVPQSREERAQTISHLVEMVLDAPEEAEQPEPTPSAP